MAAKPKAPKAAPPALEICQHKDGRWLLKVHGNVIVEATRRETIEAIALRWGLRTE